MPYRRLPNTDQARIRSLKAAVEKGETQSFYEPVISLKTLTEAKNFLPRFESAQIYYKQCYDKQSAESFKHQANVKAARLYLSHFIQVLQMSMIRGEIKESYKEFYSLPAEHHNLPDLAGDSSIAEWGEKIIRGEKKRTEQGGVPIYNPTIAKVKVRYDIFMESYKKQKELQSITSRSLEQLALMRETADRIVLDIWNQVEEHFNDVLPNEERLECCKAYGLIYYFRKRELNQAERSEDESHN